MLNKVKVDESTSTRRKTEVIRPSCFYKAQPLTRRYGMLGENLYSNSLRIQTVHNSAISEYAIGTYDSATNTVYQYTIASIYHTLCVPSRMPPFAYGLGFYEGSKLYEYL